MHLQAGENRVESGGVRPDANCSFDCAINYANFLPNKNGHFFFRNFFLKITTNSREIPAKYQPQTGDFKKKQYRFFFKVSILPCVYIADSELCTSRTKNWFRLSPSGTV